MSVARSAIRRCRVAVNRLGLFGDGGTRLRLRVEHLIDTQGAELFRESGVPGLNLIVRLKSGERIVRHWGVMDAETRAPINDGAAFQVLSLSKPVVAFLVAGLAEQGVLDLDAPVSSYLRSWTMPPDRRGGFHFERVTLRRLLSHTAGLNIHGFGWVRAQGPAPHAVCMRESGEIGRPAPGALLDGLYGQEQCLSLVHQPGTVVEYSGGGFAMAELIIEDVTNRAFTQLVTERVLAPLGMASSSFEPEALAVGRLCSRHDADGHRLPPALIASAGASGLYTTASDLCTFMECMLPGVSSHAPPGRGVISPASARMLTTVQTRGLPGHAIGLGFYLWLKRSDVVYSHRGHSDGWWCLAEGLVNRRCVIVALSNGSAGEWCVKPLVARIRQLLFDWAI